MVYYKDRSKKYTDLCIEFDREFWQETRDDFKLFKTMYLIYYMIASKRKFFMSENIGEYDEYSMFSATTIYMRFIKKFKAGSKVKSLLNYAKSTASYLKKMYQDENYKQDSYQINKKDNLLMSQMQEKMRTIVQQDYYYDIQEQTVRIIDILPKIIHKVVKLTPYRDDRVMSKNLEMSCMLTLISQLTLSNKNKEKIIKKENKNNVIETSVVYKYLNDGRDDVVCWKVSDKLSDYIKLLVNKIRKKLSKSIYDVKHSYELSDDVLDSVLYSAYAKDDVITGEEY